MVCREDTEILGQPQRFLAVRCWEMENWLEISNVPSHATLQAQENGWISWKMHSQIFLGTHEKG